jgi:putative ABC transport system permease protein
VTHAEVTTALPDGQEGWSDDFRIENRPLLPGKFQSAVRLSITAGYFDALHLPRPSGRDFSSSDSINTQPVAIVSRKFAEKYFSAENPIGRWPGFAKRSRGLTLPYRWTRCRPTTPI